LFGFGDPIFNPQLFTRLEVDSNLCRASTRGKRSAINISSYWGGSKVLTQQPQQLCQLAENREVLDSVAKTLANPATILKLGADSRKDVFKMQDLTRHQIIYFATLALVAGQLGTGEPDTPSAVDD
jgi:hypothetical protein